MQRAWQAEQQNNDCAQYLLGKVYLKGELVEQDLAQAEALFEKASAQGNSYAKYSLAKMHLAGQTSVSDEHKAIRLLKESAERSPMRRNLVPCCRPAAAGCRSHRQNFGNLARKPGPDRRSGPRRQDGQPLYLPPGIFPGIMPVTGRCRRKMRNQSAFRPALDRRSRAGRAV